LAVVVRDYLRRFRSRAAAELNSFESEPTLSSAITRAAAAERPDGRRYDHQRRLSQSTLREVERSLSGVPLGSCQSFEELHTEIERRILPIRGVGELMVYDTALRIGAKLGLLPNRVFLHRGTRLGARALALDWRARLLEPSALPPALRSRPPHEVEDILCIYKAHLRGPGRPTRRCS